MKLKGFTLAEILITLTIIGVVAALTVPSLRNSTNSAQYGPKLSKFVGAFEIANQNLLQDRGVDRLTNLYGNGNADEYAEDLTDFLRGQAFADDEGFETINLSDGLSIRFQQLADNDTFGAALVNIVSDDAAEDRPHRRRIGGVRVNISPNVTVPQDGRELFYFALYDDGSLRPAGGRNWNEGGASNHWDNIARCANNQAPAANMGMYCTGSIFEQGMRVMYNNR